MKTAQLFRIACILLILTISLYSRCLALPDAGFEEKHKSEDVIILNEKTDYILVGVKLDFLNLIIDKSIDYKILTPKGSAELQMIRLPEPIDETYFVHAPSIRNLGPVLDNSTVLSFSCTITKPDGTMTETGNSLQQKYQRTINDEGFFGDIPIYQMNIQGLTPGDILSIHYKIKIPYRNNIFKLMSCRLFIHRKFPVKSMDITFSYDKTLVVDTSSFKLNQPKVTDKGNTYELCWHADNLPGSLDEAGSHPYKDLPWFIFSPRVYETLHMDFDSFKEDFIKPWYLMTYNREEAFEDCLREFRQGVNTENNYGYNKTALRFNSLGDSLEMRKLWLFQKWIADTVRYDPDTSYYWRMENHLKDKPGAELFGGRIRDHCKDVIYAAMLPRLGYNFLNAIVMDKRVGEPTIQYYAPMHDNDLLFAVPLLNLLSYFIPKSELCNYYFEELPFYYENIDVLLLHPSDLPGYKRNYFDSLRVVKTPGSVFTDNLRNTTGSITVHVDDKKLEFLTKISLSGQYSTLTRCVYLGKPADPTINMLYSGKAWDIDGFSKLNSFSVLQNDYTYPYKAVINASYQADSVINSANDIDEIGMGGWFKHIIYPGFSSDCRVTNFYADFTGSDKYFYLLTFDKNIELVNPPTVINVENKFGSYNFSLKQTDKNKLLLTSFFMTKSEMIPADSTTDVEQLYKLIESVNKMKIKYKILTE
jgi:hypothetical protein